MRILFSAVFLLVVIGAVGWWATKNMESGSSLAGEGDNLEDRSTETKIERRDTMEQSVVIARGVERGATDAVYEGVVMFPHPATPKLIYAMSDGQSGEVGLLFDEGSICMFGEGSAQCAALSTTLDKPLGNQKVVVEGILTPDGLIVRKVRTIETEDSHYVPEAGRTYYGWEETQKEFIETCGINSFLLLPFLDVELTLKDGVQIYSTLPTPDAHEVVLDRAGEICGDIDVDTRDL